MIILGILLGLGAAFSQSLSYVCSRFFLAKSKSGKMIELLIVSHVIMGCFSLIILPFVIPGKLPPLPYYVPSMFGIAFFYMSGQAALFMALKSCEASKLTPLLGLKLLFLSFISVLMLDMSFSLGQVLAVTITVFAAVFMNWSGDKIPVSSMLWLLFTCLMYSLSDINISLFNKALGDEVSFIKKTWFAVSSSYILCGMFAIILGLFYKNKVYSEWKRAIPFSISWFIGMLFLFSCFACIDVIYGNIVQSTRGIISVILGYFISRTGYIHIEDKAKTSVWIKRGIAALLMLAAIIIYKMSQP